MEIEKQAYHALWVQIFITVPYNRTLVVRLSCIIFVCKYRKKLLISKKISDDIKQFSYEICQKHKVIIRYMETDKGERGLGDLCFDPTEAERRQIKKVVTANVKSI